jgi:hypothetical protein
VRLEKAGLIWVSSLPRAQPRGLGAPEFVIVKCCFAVRNARSRAPLPNGIGIGAMPAEASRETQASVARMALESFPRPVLETAPV